MKIVPTNTYFWKTKDKDLDVTQMRTTHLINCVILVNKMIKADKEYVPPDCFDAMYTELNWRGVDTDTEIDF